METPGCSPKNKALCGLTCLILVLVVAVGSYLIGKYSAEPKTPPLPSETSVKESSPTTDPTVNWKTYTNENITFQFPSNWTEKPILIRGSGSTQEFEDPEGKFTFTTMVTGNYNQVTGKPYTSIDEYINMPYRVKTIIIDGQEGRQPLPRAGSENINSIMFFSKDSKIIYNLELKTGNNSFDTPETDVGEGQKLFALILSTFKFLETKEGNNNQGTVDISKYYSGEISRRVPYQGLKFLEIDVQNFFPLKAELTKDDYHYQNAVIDGYTFIANQGEDFEFLAQEDRQSNPGSFIETELYGWGPTVIKMGTTIGWGVPATTRYFYVVKGRDFYGPNYSVPGITPFDGNKYGKYQLIITRRK